MAYIEKERDKNSKSNSKEKNEIIEQKIDENNGILETKIRIDKIEKFCHYFREENKQIEDVDKWNISDFFGINDLERIKQTPEYIIEKILIHLKNFINLNSYFFIMKKNEDWKNIIENMHQNNGSKKENEKKNQNEKKKEQKKIQKKNQKKNQKEEGNKNIINIKKKNKTDKDDEAEKKNKIKKEDKIKKKDKIKKEFSNSIDIKKPNKLLNKYNLNFNFEKRKFSNSFDQKKLNKEENKNLFKNIYFKKNVFCYIDNQNIIHVEDNKNFANSFEIKKKDLLSYNEKELNNNIINSSSTSKNEINKRINSVFSSTKNNNIEDNSSTSKSEVYKKINLSSFSSENNIKDKLSTSENKFEISQQINSGDFSSKNNDTSTFYNLPLSDSNISNNIKEKKIEENDEKKNKEIDTYKFRFFKNKLNLEEEDSLSGNVYEEYAKKIIKLMFILSIKKMPIFYNPQKIETDYLINFYLKQCKLGKIKIIDTPIKYSLLDITKKNKHFEIDIVFELKKSEILNFIDKFKSKIYFEDNYLKNENDKDNEEKITCFIEIARNLIFQGKEKLGQIKKYIKIIKIMNTLRNLVVTEIDIYEKILNKYKCSKETEKIFTIITDGNYHELNFILNDIVIPKLNSLEGKELKDKVIEKIKEDIRNKINEKKELFGNIINKDSLFDNIYNVFEIFYQLKINQIQFCLIYIGEVCETTCNLTNIINRLKELNYLNEKANDLKKYVDKKAKYLIELKNKYHKIKSIIHEFEKNCEKNIVFNKDSIDNILDEIDFNIFDFDNFILKHKFQCNMFICFEEDENSENIVISNLGNYFNFKTEYPGNNKEKMEIIFKFAKIDKDTPYFLIFEKNIPIKVISLLTEDTNKNIFIFEIKNEESRIGFNPDNLLQKLNIETKFKNIINQDINYYQSSYFEEQRLMPFNLGNKLINDLNIIFNLREKLNIKGIINKIKFDIPEENENKLLNYLDEISANLKINNKENYLEIKNIFKKNFDELKKNILSRHFYDIFLQKIRKHFQKKMEEKLFAAITSLENGEFIKKQFN